MPILDLPDRPDPDHFRRQARALQRAARAGTADAVARVTRHLTYTAPTTLKLTAAQFVIAREYGFGSWPRLVRYLATVAEHGWRSQLGAVPVGEPPAEFCRLACLTYTGEDGPDRWTAADRLLADRPDLVTGDISAAAAAADRAEVARLLADRPDLAVARGGPFRWRPLLYLVYSRAGSPDAAPAVARLLLDAGADPDEGFIWDALPSPFTALTGVFGHGEQGPGRQPAHPRWRALARLLLDAGADPNDAQTLYNRIFRADDDHLELLFEYGLGTGSGGRWATRIPDLDPPARLLRIQLRWAIEHDLADRVRLLAAHGVDVSSPFRGAGPAWSPGDGRTPAELALLNGNAHIVDLLVAHGAEPPPPDPVRDLIAAVFRADRATVDVVRAADPGAVEAARRTRPGLMVWAATRASTGAVTLLADLGFDVNAYGRGDAPVEQPWETALHQAAGNGDVAMTRHLLALGADPDLRDKRFGATPLDWARHQDQPATTDLLVPVTGAASA